MNRSLFQQKMRSSSLHSVSFYYFWRDISIASTISFCFGCTLWNFVDFEPDYDFSLINCLFTKIHSLFINVALLFCAVLVFHETSTWWSGTICLIHHNLLFINHFCLSFSARIIRLILNNINRLSWFSIFIIKNRILSTSCNLMSHVYLPFATLLKNYSH